jgi:hypothetical protein
MRRYIVFKTRVLIRTAFLLICLFGIKIDQSVAAQIGKAASPALAASTVVLTTSGSPSANAALVTLTATVSSTTTPIGSVTFMDGSVAIAQVQLVAGAAVFKTTGLSTGSHSLTAVYAGDGVHASATSNTLTQVVGPGATTVHFLSSANPALTGTSVTFNAFLQYRSGNTAHATPTGTLSINDGGPSIGTSPLTLDFLFGFEEIQPFAAGANPQAMAMGDFDGDGNLDVAVANMNDNTVSVLLGNGDGTFQPQKVFTVGAGPFSITAGDFNADGNLDLAVANEAGNTVSVLLGNGDGTFQPQKVFNVGASPSAVIAGDLNGDGILDLVVANNADSTVSVLLGNGDGTFQTQKVFAAANGLNNDAIDVVIADFNGDGKPDLAVANVGGNTVSILPGNGDGTFGAANPFAVGNGPAYVIAGDVNHDGILDLVAANEGDSTVSVLLGNGSGGVGDGTFQAQKVFSTGSGPDFPKLADMDGDGNLDIIVADSGGVNVSVLLGNGDGTFQAQQVFGVGNNPSALVVGNFVGGGRVDIVTGNATDNDVALLVNFATFLANFSTTTLSLGSHTITWSYAGDANFSAAISAPLTENIVAPIPTTTTLALFLGSNPSTFGQSLTLRAAPSPNQEDGAVATGTMTFTDNGTTLQTPTLRGGVADFIDTGRQLKAGTHNFTATYSGDAFFLAGPPATFTLVIQQATPVINWHAPLVPITYGTALGPEQLTAGADTFGKFVFTPPAGTVLLAGMNQPVSLTFTPIDTTDFVSTTVSNSITVNPAPLSVTANNASRAFGAPDPAFTGTVTGVVNNDGITASFSTTATAASPPGSYAITPTIIDPNNRLANYALSTTNGTLTITQAVPVITWASPAAINYGSALGATQLNATASTPGSFTYVPPSGTVLSAGNQPLQTSFTPNDNTDFSGAKGSNSITVNQVPLSVVANSASRVFGANNPAFTGTLSGVVNNDNITASFTSTATSASPAGTFPITPVLADPNNRLGNYNVSSTNGTLTITPASSSTAMSSSGSPSNLNALVTFTATVSSTAGTPTGTVTFKDGTTLLGSGNVSNGAAQLSTSALTTGSHTITAAYSGDNNFSSSSSTFTQVVNPPADFSLAASPGSATIHDGQTATFTFTLTSQFGFSSQVNLSCGQLPALAQCQFSPAALTGGNSAQMSTLTITTVAPSAVLPVPTIPRPGLPLTLALYAASFGAMWLVLFAFRPRMRKTSLAMLVLAALALVGCGGGSMQIVHQPGTPLGTSTVTVTATTTNGAISHAAPITLTVVQ